MPHPQRPISRLLIANRGEIAIRILQACHELPQPPTTFALYTENDSTHVSLGRPHHAIKAPGPSSYMNIDYLISVVKQNQIDAVHPGYGFLSENPEFSRRMWTEADCLVIGPGWEVLERTGDKLKAKALAAECDVPVLKAMSRPTGSVSEVGQFASQIGYPLMIKAVDGGGGRGIRLIRSEDALENAVQRCISESPSRTVFAEQAAIDGYKHIEIQVLGDGKGGVEHLWERDCSVQRRFQKIVEVAPAPVHNRKVITEVIASAVRMAQTLKYLGLGTWEYLVNVEQGKFFFLEINPRLQVEHTISESITGIDLVKQQLLIAQGRQGSEDLQDRPAKWRRQADETPPAASMQLRLCAEDPVSGFSLSIGKVADVQFPSGNGVRVDSHLSRGGVVGSDFDNMMAKIIVTASTWEDCVIKARRALDETRIVGVKTNLSLLKAILVDQTFASGNADTSWLERNLDTLVQIGERIASETNLRDSTLPALSLGGNQSSSLGNSGTTFRKGNAWTVVLEEPGDPSSSKPPAHHLIIDRISRNEFPEALVAEVSYTIPGAKPQPYKLTLNSTTTSADATASTHKRGDPNNKAHIVLPMSGKLMEVLVEEGDMVQENQVIAFVKQMKMELEVRSPRAGTVKWAIELENEEGEDVAEGVLLVELVDEVETQTPEIRSRL
ncbi:carbamoyl-phosphate synthase L chain, ATP binding domain-containing protein [Exophiala viscosa]|uniref:carbamoyl-phosphate synthase L chain, ATP binding domain-containing protein n=1 Tax=Exophiala viscosa TaxID=2486360 RepID=UPI0021A1A30C|nr:carbamoyl-phosphate synthase L chain, ATP binding domain-containing protein [Exophiala viscosa]